MAQSKFKRVLRKLHLILGLSSGVIVLIVSITGAIYVFNVEITDFIRHNDQVIDSQEKCIKELSLEKIWRHTQKQLGKGRQISWATIYNSNDKSWVFSCFKKSMNKSMTYFGNIEYYESIYVNPYSGAIKARYDEEHNFFNIIKMLHWSLLLDTDIGQPIVGYSTLIFVLLIITGIIMRWPKRKRQLKPRLSFVWNKQTRWRRKNYDLHTVLGIYISLVVLIVALTGLVWAFRWFQGLVYIAGAGSTELPDLRPAKSQYKTVSFDNPLDRSLEQARRTYTDAYAFRVRRPEDSTGIIDITIQQFEGRYAVVHNMQFDQYTGVLLKHRDHSDKNSGEKLITANYDIHVGSILGFPGKIIAFLVSLVSASLPVTGFMIWRGRRKKKPKLSQPL